MKTDGFDKRLQLENEEIEPDFIYENKALKKHKRASTNIPLNRSKTTQKYRNHHNNYPIKIVSDRSENNQRFRPKVN